MTTEMPRELRTVPAEYAGNDVLMQSVKFNEEEAWRAHAAKFLCYGACWGCNVSFGGCGQYPEPTAIGVYVCYCCYRSVARKRSKPRAKNFTKKSRIACAMLAAYAYTKASEATITRKGKHDKQRIRRF
jgi:hypothetical protein